MTTHTDRQNEIDHTITAMGERCTTASDIMKLAQTGKITLAEARTRLASLVTK